MYFLLACCNYGFNNKDFVFVLSSSLVEVVVTVLFQGRIHKYRFYLFFFVFCGNLNPPLVHTSYTFIHTQFVVYKFMNKHRSIIIVTLLLFYNREKNIFLLYINSVEIVLTRNRLI